jgi:hypothetical protein
MLHQIFRENFEPKLQLVLQFSKLAVSNIEIEQSAYPQLNIELLEIDKMIRLILPEECWTEQFSKHLSIEINQCSVYQTVQQSNECLQHISVLRRNTSEHASNQHQIGFARILDICWKRSDE